MDASHFRAENFARLFREFREANAHLPDRGMLKLFAEKVDVSDRYLSHVRCGRRLLGNATCRQIEFKLGKPHGWMDLPHGDQDPRDKDEQILMEQVLMLYRNSPDILKRLISEAIKEVLSQKNAAAPAAAAQPRKRRA